jgi:N-acetylmuramoyl-L-alanine amidase CwlA
VEVGYRWPIQQHGAHTKTPDNNYNEHGIGICLVGNFEETNPTPAQMRSLVKLVAYLMHTYNIAPNDVIRHLDAKPTECPGRNLNILVVRRMAAQSLVDAGVIDPAAMDMASAAAVPGELLKDAGGQ